MTHRRIVLLMQKQIYMFIISFLNYNALLGCRLYHIDTKFVLQQQRKVFTYLSWDLDLFFSHGHFVIFLSGALFRSNNSSVDYKH